MLFEAYDTPDTAKAINLAKKALKLNPNNIDAENFITGFETNHIKKLQKYKDTLDKAQAELEKEDFFNKDCIGIFGGILETRPYMRTKQLYMLTLMKLGRYTEAIKQGEELLELCENDNMGIRYLMIGIYTLLERFKECEKLYDKYPDNSIFMLLPLAIMQYKQANYTKCKNVLKRILESNEYLLDYLIGNKKFTKKEIESFEMDNTYTWASKKEAYLVMMDNKYLLETVPMFIEFIKSSAK